MGEAAAGRATGPGEERSGQEPGGFVPVLVGGRDADWARVDEDLPVDVLGARICALATRMAQATLHWLQMIAEFDRREGWAGVGIRSCAHWLAWTCSMATGTAREHVRVARALCELPLVCAEMAAGRLSYAKVREITRVADRADEATLVELARTATASQLARTVRGFRAADGSRGSQEQRKHARWWVDDDGYVRASLRMPPDEGAVILAALAAARDDLVRQSGRDPDVVVGCPDSDPNQTPPTGGDGTADGDGTAGDHPGLQTSPGPDDSGAEQPADAASSPAQPQPAPTPIDPVDVVLQWARGYLSAAPQDRSGEDRTTVVVHVNAEHLLPEQGVEPHTETNDSDRNGDADGDIGADTGAGDRGGGDGGGGDGDREVNVAATGGAHNDPGGDAAAAGPSAAGQQTAGRSRGNVKTDTPGSDRRDGPAGPVDRSAVPVDCCQIAGVGGITRETAARLACDATLIGIIRGAGGVVLAHGRKRRTVSTAQRRLLTIRDGNCQFSSCTRTSHLEAHHVQHWAHGGATDPDNLILLCRFHHIACHEGGVQINYALDSIPGAPRWQFTTRTGEPLLGDRLPSDAPGWKHDEWILWHDLDGTAGWHDPEANRIRPLWAGERFSLADAVAVLFPPPSRATDEDDPERADPAAA